MGLGRPAGGVDALDNPRAKKILEDEEADHAVFFDYGHLANLLGEVLKGLEGIEGHHFGIDGRGADGGKFADGNLEGVGAVEDVAANVAVGKEANNVTWPLYNAGGACPGAGDGGKGLDQGLSGIDEGKVVTGPHDVSDAEGETLAEGARGMVAGEVFGTEPAALHDGDGEGVGKGQHDRGARRGGEVVGAGFAFDGAVEGEVHHAGAGAVEAAGHEDGGRADRLDGGNDVEEFTGFAAVAVQKNDILRRDHAEIAVHGLGGMKEKGRGSGGGERAIRLAGNVAALANAASDDTTPAGNDAVNSFDERVIKAFGERRDGGGFLQQNAAQRVQAHPSVLPG